MAKRKHLKNVFTILEKAKKGELEFDPATPRLYSNIKYNIRGELVQPYLHRLDEKALLTAVSNYVTSQESHRAIVNIAKKNNKKLLSPDTLPDEIWRIWNQFPKEVVNDIFNINYEDMSDLKFEDRTNKNKFRFSMLEKSNNPISKVVTRKNHVKSMIYTRSMVQYYLAMMAMLQQEDKPAFDQLMNHLKNKNQSQGSQKGNTGPGQGGLGQSQPSDDSKPNGNDAEKQDPNKQQDPGNNAQSQSPSNDGNNDSGQKSQDQQQDGNPTKNDSSSSNGSGGGQQQQSIQDHLKNILERFENTKISKKIMDHVMEDARKTAKAMDEVMSDAQMEEMWKTLADGSSREQEKALKQTDLRELEKVEQELRKVSINLSGIKSTIKKLMDNSVSYFSAKEEPIFESIFDAGTLDGLQDYELLHPKLRKIFMEDINVKDIKRMGKIDIYVDASGSMNSGSGVPAEDGGHISKLTFAKAFAMRMKEMNLLNEVYSFQEKVAFQGETLYSVLSITGGGGTRLNNVVDHVIKKDRNAIILTDAEDYCSLYSDKAFFIGVAGARFYAFNSRVLSQYANNNQLVVFDGRGIKRVNADGHY